MCQIYCLSRLAIAEGEEEVLERTEAQDIASTEKRVRTQKEL
jgi:hypothetical protein